MFRLRAATCDDLDALVELARFLDSPNLPADRGFLASRLERSTASFARPGPPGPDREYQFALEDDGGRVVGTCAILSKHGTPDMPHLYLRVGEEERRSASAGVSVTHVTLQLGANADGPSEIGALVLHPDTRGQPGQPGKLLSWGRFAFMARHAACFEDRVLAEMRAAIDAAGRNAFWDAFGLRFTGMSYAEADKLSARDKSFILDLFPDTPFYASLLDERVARQLGEVHEETVPALRLLERAGLRWIGEIDPFDGGPFVGAAVADVIPIRDTVRGRVSEEPPGDATPLAIVSTEEGGGFRATAARAVAHGESIALAKEARKRLGLAPGDEVAWTPLPASRRPGAGRG